MCLSDRETIWTIQENSYMQYILGLSAFTDQLFFDPSLFVTIRKRLQIGDLNTFTEELLAVQKKNTEANSQKGHNFNNDDNSKDTDGFKYCYRVIC